MSNTMSYWVLKSGKNNCTYVLDANGKPRSYARDGAVFTNKIDAIIHALKFGGTPMVEIDGTSYPIESESNSVH
jgi:hypothetical protein